MTPEERELLILCARLIQGQQEDSSSAWDVCVRAAPELYSGAELIKEIQTLKLKREAAHKNVEMLSTLIRKIENGPTGRT